LINLQTIAIGSWYGDIGQSIYNISSSTNNFKIIGFDTKRKELSKKVIVGVSPTCSSIEFIPWLKNFLDEYNVDFYVPCLEYEMRALNFSFENEVNAKVIWVGKKIFDMFDDKLIAAKNIREFGLHSPKIYLPDHSVYKVDFPCIVKPRFSSGSKNIFICWNERDFQTAIHLVPDAIVQEYIEYENNEYTVCVFRSIQFGTRYIMLRRTLERGYTKWAIVENDNIFGEQIVEFANKLNLLGSLNIQIRKRKNIFYVFEVNPRFSSTVHGRHILGFRDFLWSIGICDIPTQNLLNRKIGTSIRRSTSGLFEIL